MKNLEGILLYIVVSRKLCIFEFQGCIFALFKNVQDLN